MRLTAVDALGVVAQRCALNNRAAQKETAKERKQRRARKDMKRHIDLRQGLEARAAGAHFGHRPSVPPAMREERVSLPLHPIYLLRPTRRCRWVAGRAAGP